MTKFFFSVLENFSFFHTVIWIQNSDYDNLEHPVSNFQSFKYKSVDDTSINFNSDEINDLLTCVSSFILENTDDKSYYQNEMMPAYIQSYI